MRARQHVGVSKRELAADRQSELRVASVSCIGGVHLDVLTVLDPAGSHPARRIVRLAVVEQVQSPQAVVRGSVRLNQDPDESLGLARNAVPTRDHGRLEALKLHAVGVRQRPVDVDKSLGRLYELLMQIRYDRWSIRKKDILTIDGQCGLCGQGVGPKLDQGGLGMMTMTMTMAMLRFVAHGAILLGVSSEWSEIKT